MWLPAVTIDAPAAEPVTLGEAKTFCRIDDETFDDQIEGFITAAREHIERITGTRLMSQKVALVASSVIDLDRLPIGPVLSVEKLTFVGAGGVETIVAPDDHRLIGGELCWSIVQSGDGWAGVPVQREVRVELLVGYGSATDVPRDLWLAILRLVRGMIDDVPVDVSDILVNRRIWL